MASHATANDGCGVNRSCWLRDRGRAHYPQRGRYSVGYYLRERFSKIFSWLLQPALSIRIQHPWASVVFDTAIVSVLPVLRQKDRYRRDIARATRLPATYTDMLPHLVKDDVVISEYRRPR